MKKPPDGEVHMDRVVSYDLSNLLKLRTQFLEPLHVRPKCLHNGRDVLIHHRNHHSIVLARTVRFGES